MCQCVCSAVGYTKAEKHCVTGCLHNELRSCIHVTSDQADRAVRTESSQPATKKQRTSLFGRYKVTSSESGSTPQKTPAQVLADFLDMIGVTEITLKEVFQLEKFTKIRPLFERILCVPASSAPVERVFSQSGLVMQPNRSRMSNTLLEEN